MAFDALTLSAVVSELRPQLAGARIGRIHQPDQHTVILRYHGRAGQGRLLFSTHPLQGRLCRSESSRDNPAQAPMFAMVLRKWLDGARIADISCTDWERVAELTIEARNDLGDTIGLRLIIEIMGKHSNLLLVNEDNIIIDGIRRYGSALSRYREVLPGRPYLSPPPIAKLPLPPADEGALAAALWSQEDKALSAALPMAVKGLSPLLTAHVLAASRLDEATACEQLGAGDISALYEQLRRLGQVRDQAAYAPCLLKRAGGYQDFAALRPACWDPARISAAPSMNQAVDAYYGALEEAASLRQLQGSVDKALGRHIQRLRKKISLEEGDLAQSEAADAYKEAGDLLSANLWALHKGPDRVELPSFVDPETLITVKLDPARTPQENVSWYYHRYAKAKKARVSIQKQLEQNRQELDYLLSIQQALEDCATREELLAVEKEAAAANYLRLPEAKGGKKAAEPAAQLPPRRVISRDGFTILIGRNNKQNDKLSLKMAAEGDIWLHTQKIPGSHVIIVSEGRPVPENTLAEAAAYAAWFSKARESGQAPVDYVEAGRLRKPPGSRPGYVTYTGQRTLYVRPEQPEEEE